jgi:polyisoprenoid-binding protein YceI
MNIRPTLAALVLFVLACSLARCAHAAETYEIDPIHTSVVFSVGHSGLSYTYGFFREAGGSYILDKTNPANCRFQFVIKANSLDTNYAKRDDHLRGPDFLNVREFPLIKFESTACTRVDRPDRGIEYQVSGYLTIHGVKRQITVPLRMLGEGLGPYKDQRTGFLCQVDLKRSDYDMNLLLENNLVGDAVSITISFEGKVPDAPGIAQQPR